ncbi:PLDc N-terminal domain-containing protein, partial [Bacillus rhizoplanae]
MKNRVLQLLFVSAITVLVLKVLNNSPITLNTFVGSLFLITAIGIAFIIFIENRSPQSTLAWFWVLAVLPVIGVFFYVLFGRSRWRRNKHLHRAEEQRKLFREILEGRQLKQEIPPSLDERSAHLATVVHKFGGGPIANETATKLLTNGEETFTEIFSSIQEAKHHIHI